MNERPLRLLLIFLGFVQIAAGCWMAFATDSFGRRVASFEGYNAHDLRDFATFFVALGLALLIAGQHSAWRFPVLALATLEYALHAINHAVDVNSSDPAWLGPAELAAVTVIAAVFGWLAWVTAPHTERRRR